MNDSEGNNNYPKDNPVAQTVQNEATASDQFMENVSETSSAKQSNEERMAKFEIEFKTNTQLEQVQFERRKLELERQMKELDTNRHLLDTEGRAWARAETEEIIIRELMMSAPNQLSLQTSHPSAPPKRREKSKTGPGESTTF